MVKPATRKPKPYVFLFQLGRNAKAGKKRVPAAFCTAPSYVYREDHEAHAKKLWAIAEPDVPEKDVDVTMEAIEAFIDNNELKPELYTDVEIEANEECAETKGFHAKATFEEAKAALARGGFVVCRVIDPLAVPRVELTPAEALDLAVEELARHLDLTSLSMILARLGEGAELPRHALHAESVLTSEVARSQADAFAAAVRAAAPGWHAEVRDTLLLLLGRAIQSGESPALRALLSALPTAEDTAVKRQLEAWGLPAGGSAAPGKPAAQPKTIAKPKTAAKKAPAAKKAKEPDGLAAKIARIEAAAKKAGVRLPDGATEAAIAAAEAKLGARLPAEVRAFYLRHDGGPDNEMVCEGRELLSLAGMVGQWEGYKKAFDAGEIEDDDVDPDEGVQARWWIPAWIPITYDFGGNHDVLDLAPAKGGEIGQVVAVWHDDATRTVEGTSFLDWLEGRRWGSQS